MLMRPEFIPPHAPFLEYLHLPEGEQEAGRALWNNLTAMEVSTSDLSYALALFEWSGHEMAKYLEQKLIPPREAVWTPWQVMAVKFGGLSIRNWDQAFRAVQGLVGRIPTWSDQIDVVAFGKLRRAFDARFPHIDKLRHSIAHPEFYANPDKNMSAPGTVSLPGVHLENVGSVKVQSLLDGATFIATFEGVLVRYDLTPDNVLALIQMTKECFEAVQTAER